ncbi:hypothetical protein [Streptococcus pantholopis]|uniref:Uncharacterized protein n=1 Tax=Streptococcus pantholopis TaxID=1811193 RepID=A0A172Q7X9_9STRE|nr:hypothetical protein [Streptococcus pantholopis]AND79505.1 hypothetical protein A0O21_05410 [Streptococcus pantholopis]
MISKERGIIAKVNTAAVKFKCSLPQLLTLATVQTNIIWLMAGLPTDITYSKRRLNSSRRSRANQNQKLPKETKNNYRLEEQLFCFSGIGETYCKNK